MVVQGLLRNEWMTGRRTDGGLEMEVVYGVLKVEDVEELGG